MGPLTHVVEHRMGGLVFLEAGTVTASLDNSCPRVVIRREADFFIVECILDIVVTLVSFGGSGLTVLACLFIASADCRCRVARFECLRLESVLPFVTSFV